MEKEKVIEEAKKFYEDYSSLTNSDIDPEELQIASDSYIEKLLEYQEDPEVKELINKLSTLYQQYCSYYFREELSELRDEFNHFESRSIQTFSIVMAMLSFIFSTAGILDKCDEVKDLFKIALVYGFAILLFAGILVLFTSNVNKDRGKKVELFIAIAVVLGLILILI